MRSLAEVHPDLLKEWSAENILDPNKVSYGSNKKAIWLGSCGHKWEASIKNRGTGHGCPICSGNRIVAGINDMSTMFPGVAEEWSERNYPQVPRNFGPKSNKSFWWKCSKCGREWQARIADRTDGHGCPHCVVDAIEERKARSVDNKKREQKERRNARTIRRLLKDEDYRPTFIKYYAEQCGEEVLFNHDGAIGVPIAVYFPNKKAAIEYTPLLKDGWKDWRYENAKNWLCLKSGITFVRILAPKMKPFSNCKYVKLRSWSAQEMNNATRQAFKKLKIQVDVNVERDLLIIAEGNHEENQEIIS